MLEVRLVKVLPHFTVDVEFCCPSGTLLAIIGPSGSGKTSIMRMIAGLDRPDGGRIVCNGEVWLDSAAGIALPARKRSLGYVFQDCPLFPHLTIEKNVGFANRRNPEVDSLLKRFGLWSVRRQKPHQVSGGERQRAALAQALIRRPRALLLDEPFSALDVFTRRKLQAELLGLKTTVGIPLVHVTHDLDEAAMLADQTLAIKHGKVVSDWVQGLQVAAASCGDLGAAWSGKLLP